MILGGGGLDEMCSGLGCEGVKGMGVEILDERGREIDILRRRVGNREGSDVGIGSLEGLRDLGNGIAEVEKIGEEVFVMAP